MEESTSNCASRQMRQSHYIESRIQYLRLRMPCEEFYWLLPLTREHLRCLLIVELDGLSQAADSGAFGNAYVDLTHRRTVATSYRHEERYLKPRQVSFFNPTWIRRTARSYGGLPATALPGSQPCHLA